MNDDHVGVSEIGFESTESWTKNRLIEVGRARARLRNSKGILDCGYEFLVIDISGRDDIDVLANIVAIVVLFDHISADGLHIADVS